MQNWKNTSQVMYIGITSLETEEGKQEKIYTSSGMRKSTATVWHSYGCIKHREYFTILRLFCQVKFAKYDITKIFNPSPQCAIFCRRTEAAVPDRESEHRIGIP